MKPIIRWYKIVFVLVALLVIGRGIQLAQAAPPATAHSSEDVDALIANAESAGTSAIAKAATILGWDEEGMPSVVLREGTNGWTCLADWPVSPGNDPQCFDPIWQAWNEAFMAGEEPEIPGLGIGYMLQGGSDPSNTDAMAMEPAPGEDWVTSPAHIMFLMPGGFDGEIFSTTPSDSVPYIMWDGTPYEHLMVPVVAISAEEMGDVSDEMASAMSSAPAEIALNATIMGSPETAGDPMIVLQEGTNGWVCYPDRAISPRDDPSCQDPIMDAGFANGASRDVPDLGLGYMLAGGSDESNTDPTASGPAEGEEWVTTPAHLMVMIPGGFDLDYYTTDHNSGYPYVMFAGTDYEHLMIPVADMPEMDMEAAHNAEIEEMKAEAIEMELLTFDLMIARDWEAYDALTHPDFYQFGPDGGYIERDTALAGLMDENLVVLAPELSEMRVQMLAPNAYVVTYRLNFNGSYDGFHFSNPRTVASAWVKEAGVWQNVFLVEQIRTAPLYDTDLMPPTVMLPNGFQPEGIAVGRDATAYVSSVGSGDIYQVNLATGEGTIFAAGKETEKALGMVYDQRTDLLYVAGHDSGLGLVYNGLTGELVANVPFTTDPDGLVNDVALADDVVYFTDSNLPLVYRLPLDAEYQPDPSAAQTISLTGEFEHLPGGINGNGIVATADGTKLIVAHTDLGKLYTVDAATGEATEFALDGEVEIYHDGLVLAGDTLYIVNYNDKIYEIALAADWLSGTILRTITDPMLEAPATAALYDDALYVVNARWDAEQTPDTEFWLTQLRLTAPVADMQGSGAVLSVDGAGGADSFATIQEALAHAAEFAPEQSVTIEVAPGDYLGPIVIDRANTALIGLSGPQYDGDGYLIGFDSPVSITIAADLAQAENIIDIRADNVTVSGFSIDGGSFKTDDLNGGIGVNVITPDTHLRGLVISDNIVENMGDTAIYTHQADATIARNRSVTPGFLGFNASGSAADGDAEVTVEKNWFVNKELGICMIGSVWDSFERGDEFGPAGIVIAVRDNYLANNTPFFGWMDGHGLYLPAVMENPYYNPAQEVTLRGEITGNTFVNSAGAAMAVRAGHPEEEGQFHTELLLANNIFEDNLTIAKITFSTGEGYAHNSSITIADLDQAIPQADIDVADLGSSDDKNTLTISKTAP